MKVNSIFETFDQSMLLFLIKIKMKKEHSDGVNWIEEVSVHWSEVPDLSGEVSNDLKIFNDYDDEKMENFEEKH